MLHLVSGVNVSGFNISFPLDISTVCSGLILRDKLFSSSKKGDHHNVDIFCGGSRLSTEIYQKCNILKSYEPVTFWGRSGHIQTILHGLVGRFGQLSFIDGEQKSVFAADGATLVYDIFRPQKNGKAKENTVILIVPGIGNNSKTTYVQAFTQHMVSEGFIVAILNHLGSRKDIPLTSPRVFSYGGTEDLSAVVKDILETFGSPRIIGLGFSMGGNVLLKLLGENRELQNKFMVAACICQGYDVQRAAPLMMRWRGLGRFYNWAMSRTVKSVLQFHKDTFQWWERRGESCHIDWETVAKATSLQELDEAANKILAGYKTVDEFYYWNSSSTYVNSVSLPILYINASDDPLVPNDLLSVPMQQIKTNPQSIFALTKYGGHLGFFKGGCFSPNFVSWLDEALKEFVLVSYDLLSNQSQLKYQEECHGAPDTLVQN